VVDRLDLHACFNLLLFNPDSTLEDVEANVGFLRAHPRNPMNFCRTEVYAGTPLERRLRAQGRLEGDPWGWDYVISDPRAQTAFEVVYAAFRERNYADRGLHHLAMRVDHEHQLLAHFFGRDETLRRRAKAFVVDANVDTCGFLDEALAAVRQGFPDAGAARARAEDLARRIAEHGRSLTARADGILDEFRESLADRQRPARTWARKAAAAAGLAATLTLGHGACKKDGPATHPTETIAAPTDVASFACEVAAVPPEAGPPIGPDAGPDAGAAADAATPPDAPPTPDAPAPPADGAVVPAPAPLAAAFDSQAMNYLAEQLGAPDDFVVELGIDAQGEVTSAALRGIALPPAALTEVEAYLRTLSFEGLGLAPARYAIDVRRERLQEIIGIGTHIFEEAPYPTYESEMIAEPPYEPGMIAPRPTHPHERAPAPPEDRPRKLDPRKK
jgi:hypothetical protein